MKKALIGLLVLITSMAYAQEKHTLSGYIKDAANGEELIGATVQIPELATGVATNVYGFYSITLPAGTRKVIFSYVGYQPIEKTIDLTSDQKVDVELTMESETLEGVDITAEREDQNVTSTEMSTVKVEMSEIKKLPALLGEVDVIKSIQLLPGVTSVGEGATGFNVRGGSIDQNLILLDEAPVYNSSHLLGFFSVFNPDAVKNVKLVKGGIPAEYGGRISSLLDVRMKEGNMKKTEVSGGIGAIFSRLTFETPLIKDKSSIILAGRRSYIDVLAKPFLDEDLQDVQFYFYDFTAKANYIVNDKNRLFLSGYFGRDVFGAGTGFGFDWGNTTASFRWNRVFNNKLFLNTTVYYSDYDYALNIGEEGDDGFRWASSIFNYSVKPEFTWFANSNNTIKFGLQSVFYDFIPGSASATSGGNNNDFSLDDKYALETGIYISNDQKLGQRISMQYGLRLSGYQYLGPGPVYTLGDAPAPGERRPIIDIRQAERGEVIEDYYNLEPRFAINYMLSEKSSVKASYNRMAQYLHLISNTTASTPLDVWQPASNNLKPQIGDQVALGYFRNLKDNQYETSVEVYYKDMQNQVDYIDDASLLLNPFLDGELLNGHGRAYGLEFYLKKRTGKLTGWISYTLGRSERQVEGINQDDWFPSRFDKTHNVSMVLMYPLGERWSASANFTYSTGTPATFPTNRIVVGDWVIPHNSEERRNNYRIPAYHRLDLSFTRDMPKASTRRFKSQLVLGAYNVYNRRNPFSVYFQQDEDNPGVTQALKYSIIAGVVPAVAWNFSFQKMMIEDKMNYKKLYRLAFLVWVVAVFAACTDPIDVELDPGTPQINIDAFIEDQDVVQRVRVLNTTDYFDNESLSEVTNAEVTLADNTGNSYDFTYTEDGYYVSAQNGSEMIKEGLEYTLKVTVGDKNFLATSYTVAPPPIDSLTFEEISGDGPGALNGFIGAFWATDIAGQSNFYWIKAFRNDTFLSDPNFLNIAQDAIQEGDAGDGLQFIPPIAQGITTFPDIYQLDDKVRVELHSITPGTYAFLSEARTQITNGGLFAEPPYNVRTNIANTSGSEALEDQAVGWFSTSMVSSIEGQVGNN